MKKDEKNKILDWNYENEVNFGIEEEVLSNGKNIKRNINEVILFIHCLLWIREFEVWTK